MHILMTLKQFEELKQKVGGGKDDGETKKTKDGEGTEGAESQETKPTKNKGDKSGEKKFKVSIIEDDGMDGTLETEDFNISYHYSPSEGRLYLGPIAEKKTLAGFLASETAAAEFLMYKLAQIPAPPSTTTGPKPPAPPNGEKDAGAPNSEEKKAQEQQQAQSESQ